VLVVALCVLAADASAEDVVVLTNGREARGKIVEETPEGVKLDVGAGRMFYPRAMVREVRRGSTEETPKTAGPDAASAPAPETREDYALLYDDGRRVGTRTLRTSKTPGGFKFDEELVSFDDKGAPAARVYVTERCDAEFLPVSFQIRETKGEADQTLSIGEVRGGRLYLTTVKKGDKTLRDDALPAPTARFPLAARELFLRGSAQLGGKLEVAVYDAKDELWRKTSYCESGAKQIDEDGKLVALRVVTRRRGDVVEREWIDAALGVHMAELAGERLRALGSTMDVVARVKKGDTERATGPSSAAKTRYADPDAGFRIGKPDPSWTFEAPALSGGGALISVRNAPLFASVDVLKDVAAPDGDAVDRAVDSFKRWSRAFAPDFQIVKDGFVGDGAAKSYWCEATATTKGEKTKTLARVVVAKHGTFRVLAACPEGAFEALRPELEKIASSFVAE